MNTNSLINFWGSLILSGVWSATSNDSNGLYHFFCAMVWLIWAIIILITFK